MVEKTLNILPSNIKLGPKKPLWNILRFSGDKIEFTDRTVKIIGFTVKEFIDQFDSLIFIDKDGREVTFRKEIVENGQKK